MGTGRNRREDAPRKPPGGPHSRTTLSRLGRKEKQPAQHRSIDMAPLSILANQWPAQHVCDLDLSTRCSYERVQLLAQ